MKLLPFLLLAAVAVAACEGGPVPNVSSFEECVNAGYPVMESMPRRCSVPAGPTFVEAIPPSIDALRVFTGAFLDFDVADDGATTFRYDGSDGTENAVFEPEAEFAVDLRGVAAGSGIVIRGWRDGDGVVHAVDVEIAD